MKLNRFLESTLLKPTITDQELDLFLEEAIQEQVLGVCVPPFWVKKVKRELDAHELQVVTVIGFPFGFESTAAKIAEMGAAIESGADELDVVWSQTAFHSGMSWPKNRVSQIVETLSRGRTNPKSNY